MHAAGTAYHDKGEYMKAITAWVGALQFACNAPKFLLNIGMAYEKLAKTPEAITAYESYIERVGAKAAESQVAKVSNLKKMLAERNKAPSTSPIGTPTPGPVAPKTDPKGGEAKNTKSNLPLGPILVGSGGLLVAGTGAALLAVGLGKTATAEERCPTRLTCAPADTDLGNEGRTFTGIGAAALGVGVAAMAGGLTWFLLGRGDEKETAKSAWTLAPMFEANAEGQRGFRGLVAVGSF